VKKRKKIAAILLGILSGPFLAALILLIPLGVLVGLSAVVNPSLAIDEFVPEEELILPFVLIAGLISAANARLASLMTSDATRIFEVTTSRYRNDPSSEGHMHGHRGRQFALDLIKFLEHGDALGAKLSAPAQEDYGWRFSIQRKGFSPLWLAVAQVGEPDDDSPTDEYVLAATLEPPLLPWSRLVYRPDFALRKDVERRLVDFLRINGLSFETDVEEWVDPEPNTDPSPRF